MQDDTLPAGFEQLAPLIKEWALPTTSERRRKRHRSSMREIRAFYDAVFPLSSDALNYLNGVPYGTAMSAHDRNLMNIYLALAEVVTAVEWYGQPEVVDGYEPFSVKMPVELP